jgi:hypothetical protein
MDRAFQVGSPEQPTRNQTPQTESGMTLTVISLLFHILGIIPSSDHAPKNTPYLACYKSGIVTDTGGGPFRVCIFCQPLLLPSHPNGTAETPDVCMSDMHDRTCR